ncbi:MAG: hypothetical protein D6696_16290, partial [Acidobacteria bacterium]
MKAARQLGGRLALALLALAGAAALLLVAPPGLGGWHLEVEQRLPREGHGRGVRAVAISADGRRVASADDGGTVHLWDATAERLAWRSTTGGGAVRALAFVPHDGGLVAGGDGGELFRWRLDDPVPANGARARGPIRALAARADGRALAVAVAGGGVELRALPSLALLDRTIADCGPCRPLAFLPDRFHLLASDAGGRPVIAGLRDKIVEPLEPAVPASAAAISPDGRRLALAGGASASVWDLAGRRRLAALASGEAVRGLRFAGGDGRLILVHGDGERWAWDWRGGGPPRRLSSGGRPVSAFAAGAGGEVRGGDDGVLRVLVGGERHLLGAPALTLAVSDDGRRVAVSRGSGLVGPGLVEIRHRPSGHRTHRLLQASPPTCLAWIDGGRRLAIRRLDGTTATWRPG